MENKMKMATDVKKILAMGAVGAFLGIFILVFKPRPDFARGMAIGGGSTILLFLALIVVQRIRGKRRFGEMDEREKSVAGRAASVALTVAIFGLALFVMLAYSIPALADLSPAMVAVSALVLISAVDGVAYLILNR